MPNLGSGGTQHVNLTYTPTWIYTPNASAVSNIELINEGRNIVYVGQADVTVNTGLPIPPNSGPVKLTNVLTPLYAISAVNVGAVAGTAAVTQTAATTSFTLPTAAVTALPVGTVFQYGSTSSTSNQEMLIVASSVSTTVITTTNASVFPHVTGDQLFIVTPSYGQIRVNAGVL
jgi:hypothetical protein